MSFVEKSIKKKNKPIKSFPKKIYIFCDIFFSSKKQATNTFELGWVSYLWLNRCEEKNGKFLFGGYPSIKKF
jgi:hypothetical protein